MKKTFLLLLTATALCLAVCKTEPDLPADPHVPLVNPFIGVWRATTGGQYWEFRENGTGGRSASAEGPFDDSFSFLYFNGKGTYQRAKPGLVILEDSANDAVSVTCYEYTSASVHWATLTPTTGDVLNLARVNGEPQVINMTNSLIGEYSADWWLPGDVHDGYPWSLKYYADGTVKTYHHGVDNMGHQFENGYALRKNTLVIFGTLRFSDPVIADITQQATGKWQVQENQSSFGLARWLYTKVDSAKWL